MFRQQVRLGEECKKPLVLHLRHHDKDPAGNGKAMFKNEERTLKLMKECISPQTRFHVHCFGDTPAFLRAILHHFPNACVGFTGCAFFELAESTYRALRATPLSRLVLETDGPYMAVPPYRGRIISHPGQIPVIAHWVAAAKNVDIATVLTETTRNSEILYGIHRGAVVQHVVSPLRQLEALQSAATATCNGGGPAAGIPVTDCQKELKRLQKALRDTEKLVARKEAGEALDKLQLTKLAKQPELLQKIEALQGDLSEGALLRTSGEPSQDGLGKAVSHLNTPTPTAWEELAEIEEAPSPDRVRTEDAPVQAKKPELLQKIEASQGGLGDGARLRMSREPSQHGLCKADAVSHPTAPAPSSWEELAETEEAPSG